MTRIEINLLPAELKRKSRGFTFDKNLVFIAGVFGILIVLVVGASVLQGMKLKSLDHKIAEAQRKVDEYRRNIELVDALIEVKDKILQRMSAIEALDKNRTVWVRIMEDLNRRVPDYLWLSLLMEEPNPVAAVQDSSTDSTAAWAPEEPPIKRVTVEGYSYSLNSLASLLIQMMGSQYFKNMELEYVKRAQIKQHKTFTFQLVGDLYYAPELESPQTDTAAYDLASQEVDTGGSEMNLAAEGE
jgi:Tfp pilus assembly protein PilN